VLANAPSERGSHLREGEVRDDHVFGADECLVQGITVLLWHEQLHERARIQIQRFRRCPV
jgi:hypothetical protein